MNIGSRCLRKRDERASFANNQLPCVEVTTNKGKNVTCNVLRRNLQTIVNKSPVNVKKTFKKTETKRIRYSMHKDLKQVANVTHEVTLRNFASHIMQDAMRYHLRFQCLQ